MTRRRLVNTLPGPIFAGPIKELRSQMRDEVAAKFVPDYTTFDANVSALSTVEVSILFQI